jgi:spore coat polysaccharide biosynthesis predicted glycosyltransferase SpsG
VVADAGGHVGMGHLARCTAVACALGERGVAVRCLAFGAEAPLELDGVSWEPITEPVTAEGLLLLDSYSDRRDEFAAEAVFVDEGEPPAGARLVIGSAGLAPPRHACLRRPYWTAPERRAGDEVRRVLVSCGAATPAVRVATAVAEAVPAAEVRVTGSEDAPGVEAIGTPSTLRGELEACDLAVTAAGQTMLEALATARPVVAVVTASNQRTQAAAAGDVAVITEAPGEAAAELAADRERRLHLARRAGELVDGRGAHRVAEALLGLVG